VGRFVSKLTRARYHFLGAAREPTWPATAQRRAQHDEADMLCSVSGTIALAVLLPLRLLCGVILLLEGYQKLAAGWFHGDALRSVLDGWLSAGKPYAFFLPVVHTAQAHPKIFGLLISLGEVTVGLSMTLGLATRAGALLGTLLLASIVFASGQGLAPPGNALLLGSVLATFVLAPPGRVVGLDRSLMGKLPRWMT
jgi:uncharacterized membrane protein YphA (DoxX/SURF4 family)